MAHAPVGVPLMMYREPPTGDVGGEVRRFATLTNGSPLPCMNAGFSNVTCQLAPSDTSQCPWPLPVRLSAVLLWPATVIVSAPVVR